MMYNSSCHTLRSGALFVLSAGAQTTEHQLWAKRPLPVDLRPAECVTASATDRGRFAMSAWTEIEIVYLENHYREMTDRELGEALSRTPCAIRNKRLRLGLKKYESPSMPNTRSSWTTEEEAFLKEHLYKMTDDELSEQLGRSKWSVVAKRRYEKWYKPVTCEHDGDRPPEWVRAYLAGLLDGEAHIAIRFQEKAVSKYKYTHPKFSIRIAVKMTELGGIRLLQKYYGGNIHIQKRREEHHKDQYVISFGASNAELLLRDVLPYLQLERKRRSAELCIALRETLGRRGVKISDTVWKERERLYQEFRSLQHDS